MFSKDKKRYQEMNLSPDSQGYIGDIEMKSVSELKEILLRKQRFLANTSILQSLPDNGDKIKQFVDRIQLLIESKEKTRSTKSRSHVTTGSNLVHRETENRCTNNVDMDAANDMEQSFGISQSLQERLRVPDETDLSVDMEKMSIGAKLSDEPSDNGCENVYEKIMQRDDKLLTKESSKSKFMPNKLKGLEDHQPSLSKLSHSGPLEESAVRPPQYKHQKSKLISLNESIELTKAHQKRSEELAIERATKRLLSGASTKMDVYNPPALDMEYRDREDDNRDLDSDDDED